MGGTAQEWANDPFAVSGPAKDIVGGKDVPAPPDYVGAARETGAQNIALLHEQTAANRPDITTQTGGYDWTQGPDGQWSLNVTDSANQGEMRNLTEGSILDLLRGGISGDKAGDALYSKLTSRLDPMWQQRDDASLTRLYNQGLTEGDAAFETARANLGRERTDAYNQAAYQSTLGADQSAASQANLINALRTGGQINMPNQPGVAGAGQGQAPDLMNALNSQYAGQLDSYNAQQANRQGLMAGGASLLAAFLSDARLKNNIRYLDAEAIPGVKWATWDWKAGGRGKGVIAQDLQKVRPDLVVKNDAGFLMVKYGELLGG